VCRGERIYTTREAAGLLGKSPNWLYGALRGTLFHYSDGSPIEPLRVGSKGRRRYTGSMLRQMARSCLRTGLLDRREFEQVLAELSRTER
jgi:DNA-binding transcriptional MerR regulator